MNCWLGASYAKVEPRTNGAFYCEWDFGARLVLRVSATILRIEPEHCLILDWPIADWGVRTRVKLEMTPAFQGLDREYGGTDLRLVHSGIPTNGRGRFELDGHNRHWRQVLGELAAYLEKRSGKSRPGAIAGCLFVGGAPRQGLLVRDVILGSPADQAGIRRDDRILRVDGNFMSSLDDFHRWIDHRDAGDSGLFELHDGREVVVQLTSPEAVRRLMPSAAQVENRADVRRE